MQKPFRWVVEIEVAQALVEAGVNLTAEHIHTGLHTFYGFSYGQEWAVKVLEAPSPRRLGIATGRIKAPKRKVK